jgi:aryl-alcohol dehydrogenase-like predicted oxidoreductase
MFRRDVEESILPFALKNCIGVIVYSPMFSGLLSGAMTRERVAALPPDDWRRRDTEFQEPNLSRNLAVAELLKKIGKTHGRTAGEAAIAWTLHNPAVTGAIVGVRTREQVRGIIGAGGFRLSQEEVAEVEGALKEKKASAAN